MRLLVIGALFALLLATGCASPEQKAVSDSYEKIATALEDGDFSTAFENLSSNTRTFLDDLAEALTFYQMPMGADGRELFGEMLAEADMTDLSRTIKSVTVTGSNATVVTETEEGDETLQFVLEDGKWCLDFETLIRDAMNEGLDGSGFTVQDLIDRTVPGMDPTTGGATAGGAMSVTAGSGSCAVTIVNGLGNWTIYYAYISPSSSDDWGDDVLGSETLAPGGTLTMMTDPGTYDIMLEDEDGDTYSRYGVEITSAGYAWEVTLADLDAE